MPYEKFEFGKTTTSTLCQVMGHENRVARLRGFLFLPLPK